MTHRTAATRRKVPGWPIAAALAILFLFLYHVRIVLLPFVVAAALSFLLSPLVDKLRLRLQPLPRWAAALVVYVALVAALACLGYWWGRAIVADFGDLVAHVPQLQQRVIDAIATDGHIVFLGDVTDADALGQTLLAKLRDFLLGGGGLSLVSAGAAAALGFILCLVLLAYFLVSGPQLARGLLWLVPPEYRDEVRHLGLVVEPVLRRYFIGLIVVVLYASVVAWIAFAIFHVADGPLLAIVIGLLELIPILGPILSIALICLAAVQQTSVFMMACLAAVAPLLRLSIDQLIGPLVLGRAAYLHPVAIMFAFLSGAVFLGVLGLVLAVPVAATIKIVLSHYYDERIARS